MRIPLCIFSAAFQVEIQQKELSFLFAQAIKLHVDVSNVRQEERLVTQDEINQLRDDIKKARDGVSCIQYEVLRVKAQ